MSIEIYYFSGTGNSLAVAKKLSEKLNATLISISKFIDLDSIDTSSETIGFIFPLYDFKPPKIFEEFISKLKNINSKYLFAVSTYGITPLKGMKYFDKLVVRYGGKLSGGFAAKMPHNGIGSSIYSELEHLKMYKNCEMQLEMISEYVILAKVGTIETSNAFKSLIITGAFLRMIPTLSKLFKVVLFKGWEALALEANSKCVGCESCMKICPVYNIRMVDNKPSWGKHCSGCLACLHWCPINAIQLGKSNINIRKYHHPEVKLEDMFREN